MNLTVALILIGSIHGDTDKTASGSLVRDIHQAFPHFTEEKKHFTLASQ